MHAALRGAARAAALLAAAVAGAPSAAAHEDDAPRVVASVKPVHSLVAAVMDGVATPRLLVPGGQSPHGFSLAPSDARALEDADLVVWVGPALESFLARPVRSIVPSGAALRLMDVEGLDRLDVRRSGAWAGGHGHDHGHDEHAQDEHAQDERAQDERAHEEHGHDEHGAGDHGHEADGDAAHAHDGAAGAHATREMTVDPHIWLDPDNARRLVDAIAGRLASIDPGHAEAYRANAAAARARIDAAEAEVRATVAPVADRPYVVFHDAYQYFERHFGLAAAGAITLSPDRQPGARRLVEVRETLRALDARCIFREPQFAPDLVETVVGDTGVRTGTLDPLGAELAPGPGLYPALLTGLGRDLAACLDR